MKQSSGIKLPPSDGGLPESFSFIAPAPVAGQERDKRRTSSLSLGRHTVYSQEADSSEFLLVELTDMYTMKSATFRMGLLPSCLDSEDVCADCRLLRGTSLAPPGLVHGGWRQMHLRR